MGLKLEQVVPWGRSLEEYIQMFDLVENDFKGQILDCAAGPASFSTQMTQQGYHVISCDPLYHFGVNEIAQRIEETYPTIINGVTANQQDYVWQFIQSPTQLGQVRMAAMRQFLADFPLGLQQGRYRTDELPHLSFNSGQFDLALCSHFLFTYSDTFSLEFHIKSILEMFRVAQKVRIFPLLNVSGEPSPYVEPITQALRKQGYFIEIKLVPYEFQKGGNHLLKISH